MSAELPLLRRALEVMPARARTIAAMRAFFADRGYLEVETPLLAPALIPESSLEVFATTHLPPHCEPRALYLIPSPEVWMKRLLAAGSGSIFQVGRSFRNCEPDGPLHSPEFTMLEWYTVGADYLDSMQTVEELIASLPRPDGAPQAASSCLRPPVRRISMDEAFALHLGTPLADLLEEAAMRDALRARHLTVSADDTWADGFHRLFLGWVEPALADGGPIILYDYPAAIPTLARRKPGTPWAERWELYAGGVELANCYSEETEPGRLRDFFRAQAAAKHGARVPHPEDRALLALLEAGLPACSGAALGVDRLLMLLLGVEDIRGTGLFAFRPPAP